MDIVIIVASTVVGAGLGWVYGSILGAWVAERGVRWFWVVAVGAFVIGVSVAAASTLLGMRPVAWGGFAFAAVAASVLKWRSGRVPGVTVRRGAKD